VAGFNQFFGTTFEQGMPMLDPEGRVWHYGVAIDQKFSTTIFAGAEFTKRDLEDRSFAGTEKYLARAYTYWIPHPWLAASAEYQFERLSSFEIENHRVPLGINFFHPSGFSAEVKAIYLNQEGQFFVPSAVDPLDPFKADTDQFWVVDTSIRYRLPNRLGFVTFGVSNLFDKKFNFQETDPAAPILQRDRIIFGRVTLAF
jgi:outer membrane receptor protein involved in Fe transport